MKPCMHCYHPILKILVLLFDRWCRCLKLLLFNYISLNENNAICYRKNPFDTKIQVWLIDVEEDIATEISGASYPTGQLSYPNFIPCYCDWNLPGSAGSVDLPQSYLFHFQVVWSCVSDERRGLFLLIWGILCDHISLFGISHLSSETQTTPESPTITTPPYIPIRSSTPTDRIGKYLVTPAFFYSWPRIMGPWSEASPLG